MNGTQNQRFVAANAQRFTQKPPPERQFGIKIACTECGTKLHDDKVELTGLSAIERSDYGMKYLETKGWGIVSAGGLPYPICADCLSKKKNAASGPLPAFDTKCKCPKCGHNRIKMKFCTGRVLCPFPAVRDHMHRDCPRCGFSFVQACKDEPQPNPEPANVGS